MAAENAKAKSSGEALSQTSAADRELIVGFQWAVGALFGGQSVYAEVQMAKIAGCTSVVNPSDHRRYM